MEMRISQREIGSSYPVFIVAEMSANHFQDYDEAIRIIEAAKEAGADAIKLQTYTPDTITIDCDREYFRVKHRRCSLYELYQRAYTPWEWQPRLKGIANQLGLCLFSSPFDKTAVDFLERMDVPAYKVASPEIIDLPLVRHIASTGKPVIMSTGMATLAEIDEALHTIREAGGTQLALLKCTSAYPALPEEMNLHTIPHLAEAFNVPVGLSDHTLDIAVPVAAVALGACIIEKHLTLSRSRVGPDSAFSLEPHQFRAMVDAVRTTEKALGAVCYGTSEHETRTRVYRRSLFVVKDMKAGDIFTEENVRSIRPGHGLHTRYLDELLGRRAAQDIERGTPLTWDLVGGTRE